MCVPLSASPYPCTSVCSLCECRVCTLVRSLCVHLSALPVCAMCLLWYVPSACVCTSVHCLYMCIHAHVFPLPVYVPQCIASTCAYMPMCSLCLCMYLSALPLHVHTCLCMYLSALPLHVHTCPCVPSVCAVCVTRCIPSVHAVCIPQCMCSLCAFYVCASVHFVISVCMCLCLSVGVFLCAYSCI